MTYYAYNTLHALSGLGFRGRISDELLAKLQTILSEHQLEQLGRLNTVPSNMTHDALFTILDTWDSENILDLMETIAQSDMIIDYFDDLKRGFDNREAALDLLIGCGITTMMDRDRYKHVDRYGEGDAFTMLRDLRAAHECGVISLAAGAL
jgi:hypothetical protein